MERRTAIRTAAEKIEELRKSFFLLTEDNQRYVLGVFEGLRFAQKVLRHPLAQTNPKTGGGDKK
jgi:hypothetical protein